ncbi:MAG: tetraacyldisaccharide 4'-kinase [Candidatus Omnitrophota bacterium]
MAGLSKKEKIKKYLQCITVKKNKSVFEVFLTSMLFVLSSFYRFILILRLGFYDLGVFPVYNSRLKVISVGNITVGGTGKTPLVAMIAEFLLRKKQKVAIISRGYKAMNTESGLVADEPLMLTKQLPDANIIINVNRLEAIKSLEAQGNKEVVILDDAFQNCGIKKSLDIVCINSLNPFGNNYLIPCGILRLPFAYLKRADIFVLTHCGKKDKNSAQIIEQLRKYNQNALICKTRHVPECFYDFYSDQTQSLESLKGKKIAIVCAIAQPDNFKIMLESLTADIGLKFYFPDHHNFSQTEIKNILAECDAQGISLLVTTAKDEPRLKLFFNQDQYAAQKLKILVLKIKISLEENEEGFIDRLSSIFAA